MTYRQLIIIFLFGLFIVSCNQNKDMANQDSVEALTSVFTVLSNGTTMEMNGEITSSSLSDFNALYARYPNTNLLSIKNCDGSSDDDTNYLLMKHVYDLNFNTHLQDNGIIASGGTDLFLSGRQRSIGVNTKIGVHAWSDEDNNSATDYPVGHAVHTPYINSYVSIGLTQSEAETLYYFIINAAAADAIHWMTADELQTYRFLTN